MYFIYTSVKWFIYSTHPLSPTNPIWGHRRAGAYPSCHRARGRVHPQRSPVCRRVNGVRQPFTSMVILASSSNHLRQFHSVLVYTCERLLVQFWTQIQFGFVSISKSILEEVRGEHTISTPDWIQTCRIISYMWNYVAFDLSSLLS